MIDQDTKAMLRSRIANKSHSRTDDEASAEEWIGILLDSIDEAEADLSTALDERDRFKSSERFLAAHYNRACEERDAANGRIAQLEAEIAELKGLTK